MLTTLEGGETLVDMRNVLMGIRKRGQAGPVPFEEPFRTLLTTLESGEALADMKNVLMGFRKPAQADPGPPLKTFGEYEKKSTESSLTTVNELEAVVECQGD